MNHYPEVNNNDNKKGTKRMKDKRGYICMCMC